ncbi:mucin-associated surface protein (MASP), putative [Trypanosoma cruzi]|nr:mucin-associated surface protein (MASP), putative [Trypanosoma cruzi]
MQSTSTGSQEAAATPSSK